MNRFRVLANLATVGNGAMGAVAIAYVLLGNSIIAIGFLIVAILFDGADGWLARQANTPGTAFGRIADSTADAVSFGLAPAVLIAVHHFDIATWGSLGSWPVVVGALFLVLALSRLAYFTLRGFAHPYFVGASTPQATLGVALSLLLLVRPGYLGNSPLAFLLLATGLAALMVVPLKFPKVRRGQRLRPAMILTTAFLPIALVPIQFAPATGSPLYLLSEAGTIAAAVGMGVYFVLGPFYYSPGATAPEGRDD
ncbi:MAG: CDP-alcohol phosphatidyltransferase family protein [Thermoplasmata archaeon]|nr:CDP-alcohol phosphatidyltransferase family protein [Thermoplasmata archaeon]